MYSFQPNKTTVVADAIDEILWDNLPPFTHWYTEQVSTGPFPGATNEYDYEGTTAYATFAPAGLYYITISADDMETVTLSINATEPPPDLEPEPEE